MVEAAGQAATVRTATRAATLAEAAALVETTTGKDAATEEVMGRELA